MFNNKQLVWVCACILLSANSWVGAQQLKMGKNLGNLRSSAILELEDTNKTLLLTRVWDPVVSIASAYRGMLAYDSSRNLLAYYNGNAWGWLVRDSSIFINSSSLQSRRRVGMNGAAVAFYGSVDSLVIANTGYVGIGVGDAPISPLHVSGGIRTDNLIMLSPKLRGKLETATDSLLMWNSSSNEVLAISPDILVNQINIYNTDGATPNRSINLANRWLTFNGGDPTTNTSTTFSASNGITVSSAKSSGVSYLFNWTAPTTSDTYGYYFALSGPGSSIGAGKFSITNWRNNNNDLVVDSNGYVGIGTSNPRAPLHVTTSVDPGWGSNTVSVFSQFGANSNWLGAATLSGMGAVSIITFGWATFQNGLLVSDVLPFTSDARIKNIIGQSKPEDDLRTLSQIKITDYTYKDHLRYSPGQHKKVMAQEVEKVYPQAVMVSKDFIPNIYAIAQDAHYEGSIFTLTMPQEVDLKVGDTVQLYQKNKYKELPVNAVSGHSFSVSGISHNEFTDKDPIFVYGKQVNDFKTVDYNALSMLNVSATQALSQKLRHAKEAIAAEREKVKKLQTKVAKLKALIEKM